MEHGNKILIIIPSLVGGGAERVTTYLIEYLSNNNFRVELLLLRPNKHFDYKIREDVKIHNLNLKTRIRYSSIPIVKAILKIRPDVCFVNMNGVNLQLSIFIKLINFYNVLRGHSIRFIARETNVLSPEITSKYKIFYKWLYSLFYNNYNRIIVQSEDMRHDMISSFGIKESIISKINNPINTDLVIRQSKQQSSLAFNASLFNFVCLGRITYQKGYDILFKRISELDEKIRAKIHIYILGTGPLESELKDLVDTLNLGSYISFEGFQLNPYVYLAKADGLILSSRYEGFPNVLLESGVLGVPVLANRCPGGINEIIIPEENGLICDMKDSSDFKQTFAKFLSLNFSNTKIINSIKSRYDSSIIMPKYLDVFKNIRNHN